MLRTLLSLAGTGCLLLAGTALAQTSGTYTPFGSGCPGTGSGGQAPGIVLPAAQANAFGNSQNVFGVGQANTHYQQVFLASEIGGAKIFFGYALRENEAFTRQSAAGIVTYTILLGYTTYDPATITATYASNYNTSRGNPVQVFQGNVNLPSMPGNNPNPADFAFEVKFAGPWVFAYKPGENLLFEQQATHTTSIYQYPDAGSGIQTTRIYNTSSSSATTGTFGRNYGLIMKWLTGTGGGAVPQLGNTGTPDIGKSFNIDLSKAKASTAAALLFGASNTMWGAIPLPFDLTAIGASGCSLLASPDALGGFPVDGRGVASALLPLPNDTRLRGVVFHNQWLVIDAGANRLGIAFSNGGTAKIGG